MRAAVKWFHSPDQDLEVFVPEDPGDAGALVQIFAGPQGTQSEESFDVVVCTPRFLNRRVQQSGPLVGRHYLIVEGWDWPMIRAYLTQAVESEEAPTWEDLGIKLGRIGKWEFEDYQP